ncbi:MAG TPA: cation:proton antiporter [Opitutaceae bacterium]|nr:cation:proton antiporter [Opitutaceae bacterium]
MNGIDFIQDLAVIFLAAGAAGWLCRRLGLSVVAGYLAAGMLVGPRTLLWPLVANPDEITALAQIGLVFLMFSIGLRLSVRRMRSLGGLPFLATGCAALIMFCLARLLGVALGWNGTESLFLAGMLMVSSSAVISKVLHETGVTHERAGQLALALTVLEDIVAVVMLALLNTVVQLGEGLGRMASVGTTLATLAAFVALTGVAGLLVVPWLLRRLNLSANDELKTLSVAGLVFALALVAREAGFSLALGAFLLGVIVAETAHRASVERAFEGLRDVFTALFFTAIGMQIDLRELGAVAGLIAGVAAFTLVARSLAAAVGLALVGARPHDALRAGLSVTPIGEFSFIIAQLGVGAAVVPEQFFPLAVGVSMLTTLAAPLLTRHAERIAVFLGEQQPGWLRGWLRFYRRGFERAAQRRQESRLWQMCRRRFVQIGVEILVVTGLLVFSEQLFAMVNPWLSGGRFFPYGPEVIFWTLLGLLVLAPLLAIWRNCSALALLYAQTATAGRPREAILRPAIETGIKALVAAGMVVWLASILPVEGSGRWLLTAGVLAAVIALVVWRRKLVYWHSELEVELQDVLGTAGRQKGSATSTPWFDSSEDWDLTMADCLLPDLTACAGKSIHELGLRVRFGCTVVGIERQGFTLALPPPETPLYPRDKVLIVGTPGQVAAGKKFLGATTEANGGATFEDVHIETMKVPAWSSAAGRTLGELEAARNFGVQVAGVRRGGVRILSPGAGERLQAGDDLLILGAPKNLREFEAWLKAEPANGPAGD